MKINENRLFPYPLLRNGNGNFSNSKFEVKAEYKNNELEYEFNLNVSLIEKNLLKLIENEDVSIVCHLECAKTKFRSIQELSIGNNDFKISVESLDGRLELNAFIIAKKEIKNYSSFDFDSDYEKKSFLIQKGDILGIADIPAVYIENRKENLSNLPSIFEISYTKEYDIMKLILNEDRIKILLPTQEYSIRNSHKNSLHSRNIMNVMIVFPALVAVLNELSHKDSIQLFGNHRWFKVINKKLKELGYNLEEKNLEDERIFEIAQNLLDELFSDAMDSLNYLEDNEE